MEKLKKLIFLFVACILMVSCKSNKLVTKSVSYQSVRTNFTQPESLPTESAEILLCYSFDNEGRMIVIVKNLSEEIMTIDQQKTFFVNSTGMSTSYFDPKVQVTSSTTINSNTSGASVNLGAVAGAFGVGGVLGNVLKGVNVGGSNTVGTQNTNSIYTADQEFVNLAPQSQVIMSKMYTVDGLLSTKNSPNSKSNVSLTSKTSNIKFAFCIYYSIDNGETYKKLKTDFFVNSDITIPVASNNKINDAVRKIYIDKPDAVSEKCWSMYFDINIPTSESSSMYNQGVLYDFQ